MNGVQVASLYGELSLKDEFTPGLERAERGASSFGSNAVKAIAPVATALTAIGVASIKVAIDFESAFAGVVKTVDLTSSEMDDLRASLREMARDANSPLAGLDNAAVQLAGIAEQAGQLGIEGKDNILAFVETMGMLRLSAESLGEDAPVMIAKFLNVMGESTQNVDRLGSSIVALGNSMATDERAIVEFSSRIASAGALMRMTSADVTGWSAALSSIGLNAELGGTNFSKLLTEIASSVGQGGAELARFADIAGMSSNAFKQAWGQDANAALLEFITGLGQLDQAGQLNALNELGLTGSEMTRVLLGLANNTDLVTEALNISNQAWDENTAAQDEAAKRFETTQAKINLLKNNLNDIGISIGDALLPVVNAFLGVLSQGIDNARILADLAGIAVNAFAEKYRPELDALAAGWETLKAEIGLTRDATNEIIPLEERINQIRGDRVPMQERLDQLRRNENEESEHWLVKVGMRFFKINETAGQLFTIMGIGWDRASAVVGQFFTILGIGWENAKALGGMALLIIQKGIQNGIDRINAMGAMWQGVGAVITEYVGRAIVGVNEAVRWLIQQLNTALTTAQNLAGKVSGLSGGFADPVGLISSGMGILGGVRKLGGFASGGEFMTPASMGSTDKPVMMGLRGGEHVKVTPPGGSAGGGFNVTINITGGGDPYAAGQAAANGFIDAARQRGLSLAGASF